MSDKLLNEAINECVCALVKEMMQDENMIPITVEAALAAGTLLRGAEFMYDYFTTITDHLALQAAKERDARDERTGSIMQKFGSKGN